MRKSDLHNFLLGLLNVQQEMGLDSESSFVFDKLPFCHSAVISLFSISSYLINKVVKEHKLGQIKFCHANQGNIYYSEKRDRAVAFIQNFARIHCENLPDQDTMRLPSYMNVTTIFNNYSESVPKEILLKERSFAHVFKTIFGNAHRESLGQPRITFLPCHSHPICTECAKISDVCKC